MNCVLFICVNHSVLGCGCLHCRIYNGEELTAEDVKLYQEGVI